MKPSEALKEKMAEFKMAVWGLPCMGCGKPPPVFIGSHRSHHVFHRQHLPVEYEWDPRNAGPACDEPFGKCHQAHHNASRRLPASALTETHWEFGREVLGDAAEYYVQRYYGGGLS